MNVSVRRIVIAGCLAAAPAIVACVGVLGLRPLEVVGGEDSPVDGVADSGRNGDADADAEPEGRTDGGQIDCLGAFRDAFYCDGFESPSLATTWEQILKPASAAQISVQSETKLAGAQALRSGFAPIPATGEAKVHFPRPGGAGPLSLQVSVHVDLDAWETGEVIPLFALRAGTASPAVVVFVASGVDGAGQMELRVAGGPTIALGAVVASRWDCYEIAFDGATVTAFRGTTLKGTAPSSAAIDGADIGMEWNYGENALADKHLHYDDAVIAAAPIGCLH